jgi:hypothetical protein
MGKICGNDSMMEPLTRLDLPESGMVQYGKALAFKRFV